MNLKFILQQELFSTCGKFQFLKSSSEQTWGTCVDAACLCRILLQPYEQKGASVSFRGISFKRNGLSGLETCCAETFLP